MKPQEDTPEVQLRSLMRQLLMHETRYISANYYQEVRHAETIYHARVVYHGSLKLLKRWLQENKQEHLVLKLTGEIDSDYHLKEIHRFTQLRIWRDL